MRTGYRDQHPAKNTVRKSKKSWLLVAPSWLKSALPPKNAVRKSKKSWLLRTPSAFQSAGHGGAATVNVYTAVPPGSPSPDGSDIGSVGLAISPSSASPVVAPTTESATATE